MLKSTHKPTASILPLPLGWTEHKAPTGHPYYYHTETKKSTYTRPSSDLSQEYSNPQARVQGLSHDLNTGISGFRAGLFGNNIHAGPENEQLHNEFKALRGARSDFRSSPGFRHHGRAVPQDKPRSKHAIPGCSPWLLVKTKFGRRFVYHPEKGESFWKFPAEVIGGVVEYDIQEIRRKKNVDGSSDAKTEDGEERELQAPTASNRPITEPHSPSQTLNAPEPQGDSDEYEEVEVTDDENEEAPSKRLKTEEQKEDTPVEFDEDDIAYQLAAMGQDHGLDPGEYGHGVEEEWEEGAEGLPLTEEDSSALFQDLLDDYRINPYIPWERIVEEGSIIEDDRYTVLPNMRTRKEIWDLWSRERIQRLKEQREREEKTDPRIPYLSFLQKNATPKLYWPEFRRKFKREPEMRDTKLSDKDREKWYRDYINRLKLPESTLKFDINALLKSLPVHVLNRSTNLEALPPAVITDIRYISLRPTVRNPLIDAFIATAPPAPEQSDISPEEEAELENRKRERERREKALADRERAVQEVKRKQEGALRYSKGMLREGEEEVQRAMMFSKEGLFRHLELEKDSEADRGSDEPKLTVI